jgi:hypothetical protein
MSYCRRSLWQGGLEKAWPVFVSTFRSCGQAYTGKRERRYLVSRKGRPSIALRIFTKPTPTKLRRTMSTDYGYAIVQFPGFKPASFHTVNGTMAVGVRPHWPTHWTSVHLPPRKFQEIGAAPRRLSRKERSKLRTFAKKWNKGRQYRTLKRRNSCY